MSSWGFQHKNHYKLSIQSQYKVIQVLESYLKGTWNQTQAFRGILSLKFLF